jgi:hypothetical protein
MVGAVWGTSGRFLLGRVLLGALEGSDCTLGVNGVQFFYQSLVNGLVFIGDAFASFVSFEFQLQVGEFLLFQRQLLLDGSLLEGKVKPGGGPWGCSFCGCYEGADLVFQFGYFSLHGLFLATLLGHHEVFQLVGVPACSVEDGEAAITFPTLAASRQRPHLLEDLVSPFASFVLIYHLDVRTFSEERLAWEGGLGLGVWVFGGEGEVFGEGVTTRLQGVGVRGGRGGVLVGEADCGWLFGL